MLLLKKDLQAIQKWSNDSSFSFFLHSLLLQIWIESLQKDYNWFDDGAVTSDTNAQSRSLENIKK